MKNKILLTALVLMVIAVITSGVWYKNKKQFDPSVNPRTFKTAAEFENFYKNLEEVYKNDTYGGATPEETLQLFIDALKKGDTDLAVKYFIPEKQKEEGEKLRIGKEKNNLDFLLGFLEKAGYGKQIREGVYQMAVAQDGKAIMSFDFVLNKYTSKWKIESI